MAYSQYYGKSGDYIKEIQKLLNDKGAGLSVDGVWGDETERAYQQLGSITASSSLGGSSVSTRQNSSGLSYYDYTAPSDAQLLERAQAAVSGEYDAMLAAEEEKAHRLTEALQRSISALDPAYQQRLDLLEEQFNETREYLANDALKRGMGRSTHYLGMVDKASDKHLTMVDRINQEYRDQVDVINQEILDVQRDLLSNKGMISAKQQSAMRKYLDQPMEDRDDRILAMVKYNNSVRETELALAAKASSSSRSGGGRSSGSSGKSSSGYSQSVQTEWARLTKPGKIAFFDQIADELYSKDRSLYNKLKNDVASYRKQGYFAAVNKEYNYYTDTVKPYRYTGPR